MKNNTLLPIALVISILFICWMTSNLSAQYIIYDDTHPANNTWNANDPNITTSLAEVISGGPLEGTKHLQFTYMHTSWWSGFGINLDAWGAASPINFSGYQYLSIAYKGLSTGDLLTVVLKNGSTESAPVDVGIASSTYNVVNIPLNSFAGINLSAVTEMVLASTGVQVSNGQVYIDDIKLISTLPPYNGANVRHTDPQTWARFADMDKGLNFSNWLEAYWLLPNNFPDVNRFTRPQIQELVNMGFDNFRLPVTFERVADGAPNYTIPPNHIIWALIDSTIVWAEEMDFTLSICNHHGYELTNANYTSEVNRKKSIWHQVMTRYQGLDPERYFFELFNEPTNTISNANLHTVMDTLIQVVRSYNTDHTLIIGGNGWNSATGLMGSETYADSNIIYTYHDYEPYAFSHQQLSWTTPPYLSLTTWPTANSNDSINMVNRIAAIKYWADTSGVPVMLGELGASTGAPAASRCAWIRTQADQLALLGIPWYYWDATTLTDAFGFFNSNFAPIACFGEALDVSTYNTCDLLVTTLADTGEGSFRQQLACASDGDTIRFSPSLAGDTITAFTSPFVINKDIILYNAATNPIYITADYDIPILAVGPQSSPQLIGINVLGRSTDAIINQGTLAMKHCEVSTPTGIEWQQKGQIIIQEDVQVKHRP